MAKRKTELRELDIEELAEAFAANAIERGKLVDSDQIKQANKVVNHMGDILDELISRGDAGNTKIAHLLESTNRDVRWSTAFSCSAFLSKAREVLEREALEPMDWRTFHAKNKLKDLK